jgi:lysophospholipase L1-like esterase
LIASLGIAELSLRLWPGWSAGEGQGAAAFLQVAPEPDLVYELRPNTQGVAWDAEVAINAQGRRGRLGTKGPAPVRRVVVLGDSITFGNRLAVEDTYAAQLQELLDATEYEVLNFGVGGYDVAQSVAQLEHRALEYEPRVVVLGYCLNDIAVASQNLRHIEMVRRYQASWLLSRSRLLRWVVGSLERETHRAWLQRRNDERAYAQEHADQIEVLGRDELELRGLMDGLDARPPAGWYRSDARVGRLRWAFSRLGQLARRHHARVVVVVFPWLERPRGEYPYRAVHTIVRGEAERAGLEVEDLSDAFMELDLEALRIDERDLVHPSRAGHHLAAERLHRWIVEETR